MIKIIIKLLMLLNLTGFLIICKNCIGIIINWNKKKLGEMVTIQLHIIINNLNFIKSTTGMQHYP